MTDDKNDLNEIDWESALSEWDSKKFVPEVAKDKSTDQRASLSGGPPPKPLYRPPPAPPPAVAKAPLPTPPPPPATLFEDSDGEDQTRISVVPKKLLEDHQAAKAASRGGLSQLFARDEKQSDINISFEDPRSSGKLAVPSSKGPVSPYARNAVPDSPETLKHFPPHAHTFGGSSDPLAFDPFALPAEEVPSDPLAPFGSHEPARAGDDVDDLLGPAAVRSPSTQPPPPGFDGELESLPPEALEKQGATEPPPTFNPSLEDVPKEGVARESDVQDLLTDLPPASAPLKTPPPLPPIVLEPGETHYDGPTGAAFVSPVRIWRDEKPAALSLSEQAREDLVGRAAWLEQEARTLQDKAARARGLLVCSEIVAIAGDASRAYSLAVEARDLLPSLALAHRQARALMPHSTSSEEIVEALDAEVRMAPAGPARTHSTLLAADVLLVAGDDDGASKRLDQCARNAPGDVRAPIARAARALARGETASAAFRLADNAELAPIASALQAALRLRGVERKDAATAEPSPNELLLRARQALDSGDLGAAAPLIAKLGQVPELARGATWLAAALGAARPTRRAESLRWLQELAETGALEAQRLLLARAIELGDKDVIATSLARENHLTVAERTGLSTLLGVPVSPSDPMLAETAATPGMNSLAAAAAALSIPRTDDQRYVDVLARAGRTAGTQESRALVGTGRLIASYARPGDIEKSIEMLGGSSVSARAVALEMATHTGRLADVCAALEKWGTDRADGDERAQAVLAAAIIAEHGNDTVKALESYKTVRAIDPTNEAALRAIASLESIDLVAELNTLADELSDGPRSALTRLEAVVRGEALLPDPTRIELLEKVHRAAPSIPIASFLIERIARRSGDVEDVVRAIRERRGSTTDPIETAIDGIREALLVADSEPSVAAERLLEALRARPGDFALRELCERMAPEPSEDRAAWREQRAGEAEGDARTLLFLEASQEYERSNDEESALRTAEAATAAGATLGAIARERTELRAGHVSRLADELLTAAKSTEDSRERREAYERLAVLDASARQDPASALLWHRSILEEAPGSLPSLRHVEHHLIGEGRDDELEPVASAIAVALRGHGSGECSAHAELAARLRMRGTEGSWDATRDPVHLAASEQNPSLWSLRMLQSHARAHSDDAEYLSATQQLIERSTRPNEAAVLLVRAGETAARLNDLALARTLLERAAGADPGDVVVWGLLADVRQREGDARGAAEACESMARASVVVEHRLLAWHDAGRIWCDEVHDDERAIIALEAAAAIDVAHEDVFDRLSRIYATRKMQAELANLLERRIESISDVEERIAMEVRRGRILLEVGDVAAARSAYETVLADRPDDTAALSAFADLCVSQDDSEGAEQALVRLARLLPSPDEQRDVYARLGDLYSSQLLNLPRAEVAFKEVLRRAPEDVPTIEKLVSVYKRQNDAPRAVELQQEIIARSLVPEEKRRRVIELASIYEVAAHDNKRAEQTLESARREFPQDVGILRATAEFYIRHQQMPAVNIMLDRAAADARRALSAGRFAPTPFGVLATSFDLRGKKDAARVTLAMLAACEGKPAELGGAWERAFTPQLNDLLAPDVLSAAMRALILRAGDALDAATPVDLNALKASPLAFDSNLARLAAGIGQATGLGPVQVLSSARVGPTAFPVSNPPLVIVGESLLKNETTATFVVLRALKLMSVRASAFGRTSPSDLAVLVSAWLKCFNPTWQPQGINAAALNSATARVRAALPKSIDPSIGVIALEVAGTLGTQAAGLGPAALAWGNRSALLAMGDPNAAVNAIAAATGQPNGAPTEASDRMMWIGRAAEARDLFTFAVSEAFAEARSRLGMDR